MGEINLASSQISDIIEKARNNAYSKMNANSLRAISKNIGFNLFSNFLELTNMLILQMKCARK
jgi:hypothetical protein